MGSSRRTQEVVRLEDSSETDSVAPPHPRRRTRGGVPPKVDAGYGLRLRFAKPVTGPLLLGYGSHFGLGRFAAVRDD
ncbi:MAG TPA: hypothetical protein PKC18_20555 [Lacipirellulaceae bacterium]|nr:hypothetical protein [Lacipirellulaceae bacterium]